MLFNSIPLYATFTLKRDQLRVDYGVLNYGFLELVISRETFTVRSQASVHTVGNRNWPNYESELRPHHKGPDSSRPSYIIRKFIGVELGA